MTPVLSPGVSDQGHPPAPVEQAKPNRKRLIWLLVSAPIVVVLLLLAPGETERYRRRDSKEYLHVVQVRLEMFARSRPALGTSILERYPASLAQLKWDKDMDQPGEDTRRSFFQIPAPKNWHMGRPVGDVPVTQPMAGEISYLPLKGQATLPDGSKVDDVYGYALFLWGGRRLKHDWLVKGDGLEMPVALLLESGLDKRTYAPGTIFPDTIQSIDEALAAYGLVLVRKL